MSLQDAKAVLGFPPGADPSPGDIKDAWKAKAFENHPDRGGDPTKMVEINVAKDVLEGKQRPSYDRGPSYQPSAPRTPQKGVEVSFNEAKSKAGVPGGVEWKFVTDTQRGTNYSSDEFDRSDNYWVAYGRTDAKHVFVGMRHYVKKEHFMGGQPPRDEWGMHVFDFPIKGNEGTEPAWLYGNVVGALKKIGFEGRFNSKVVDAKGWSFSEKMPHGSDTSIKHWLAGSGEVSEDDPRVQNRKHVVEIKYSRSYTEKPNYYKFSYGRPPNTYEKDFEAIEVIVNSKAYYLGEADAKRFLTSMFKGHHLLDIIFGAYYYDGSKKILTRAKSGKAVIKFLADNMQSLPDDVRKTLQSTVDQMK